MIAELHGRQLPQSVWGAKAARLATAAAAGLPVPPALCLDHSSIGGAEDVVRHWLEVHQPAQVIVRSSDLHEDSTDSAHAGRSTTIGSVSPEADEVCSVVRALIDAPESSLRSGGAVLIQQQVPVDWAGVTFSSQSRLITEVGTHRDSVTSGKPPAYRIRSNGAVFDLESDLPAPLPSYLLPALWRLYESLRQLFPFELDFEWAATAGAVLLVQVRPVTVAVNPGLEHA
jgi:hypothetical protein